MDIFLKILEMHENLKNNKFILVTFIFTETWQKRGRVIGETFNGINK